MADTVASQSAVVSAAPARGLAARVVGILTSPRDTYADIAARPQWFGLAAVVLVFAIVSFAALMSTDVGQRAALDQQIQTFEGFGRSLNPAQYQMLQRSVAYLP